jgi:argininosuccinate lyase
MKARRTARSSVRQDTSHGLIRGRFARPRLPEVEAFTASLPFDRRLYKADIQGSIAHTRMLAKVGLITRGEAARIQRGLRAIEREIARGKFRFDIADEDIHLTIERRLTEKIGAAGAKLHTARSRNDQVALDMRLYLREAIPAVLGSLRGLASAMLSVARRHVRTVMPGYTHLQRAQPVSLGHHLVAHVEALARDRERFHQALARLDVMPLGAGALAATTLPIDPSIVARELGFKKVAANSIDAVSDRDFVVDFLSAAALCMVHLSRMSEELVLWSSAEFGFLTLPDEFATGSSMMPQKKNPDLLELIRGKSGRMIGDLVAMLTVLKGLPLAYNSDLQEDKELVFDALDTLQPALELMAKLWARMSFNRVAMRNAAGGDALATDVAEHLVKRGMPFRQAHEKVGALVRELSAAGKSLSDIIEGDLRRRISALGDGAGSILSVTDSIARRKAGGGPAPATVLRRIKELTRLFSSR